LLHNVVMQRFLTKLTPEQAEAQQKRIAAEAAKSAAAAAADAAAAAAAPKPGPGRRPKSASLMSQTAAASSSDEDEDMPAAAVQSRKRGYTSWLTSDDFHFVHDAVRRRQSFRGAVRELQERFPKLKTQEHSVTRNI
jgi:hypothetical protein